MNSPASPDSPRRSMVAALAAAALVAACSTAPVAPSSRPPRAASQPIAPVASLSRETLELQPWVTLNTANDTPSPAFGGGGRWLVYRVARGDARHHDVASEVHALDLAALEDRIVYSYEHAHTPYNAYPMGGEYGLYGATTTGPTQDVTFHPAMLGRSVITGGPSLVTSYLLDAVPDTFRISFSSVEAVPFGSAGTHPRVSPDERLVLLHTASGITVHGAQGTRLQEYPGYFGVWAPDSDRFLAHVTPYLAPDLYAGSIDWSLWQIEPSWENAGGLVLAQDGQVELLTAEGGAPTWFPDGAAFIYEKPAQPGARTSAALVRFDLQSRAETVWAEQGWQPAVHPGGGLVFFDSPDGLTVADAEGLRPLDLEGSEATLSPDGRLLCVQVSRRDRRGRPSVDLDLYRLR